jgi:hypothetical protein
MRGLSTKEMRGVVGLKGLEDLTLIGLIGISTMGDGVRLGIKSDWPVDRKIPLRTGHGAELLFAIITIFIKLTSQILIYLSIKFLFLYSVKNFIFDVTTSKFKLISHNAMICGNFIMKFKKYI